MAKIEITIPDDKVKPVQDAFCGTYNYEGSKLEGETKAQFTKRKIVGFIKEVTKSYAVNQAVDATRETELAKPDAEIA